ncbi:MAG: SpoIIE family protein phosphatase [Chloroflexi bacterium]|nr:SpoIIE family protein phosphatase [Chloroflexota bacterium]
MTRHSLFATTYALSVGVFGIGALIVLTDWNAWLARLVPLAFFAALSFFLKRAGFHAAPEVTHSLVGIIDLAAVFIFGPILGAWVAASSGFAYLFLNAWRRDNHTFVNLVEMPIFNAGLKIGMAYASTHLYTLFGGTFAPKEFTMINAPAVLSAALTWFVLDHIGWATLEFLRGGVPALWNFFRTVLGYSVLVELLPLPFAIAIAVAYTVASTEIFLLMAAGLVGTAIIVQRYADASARLERRSSDLAALNQFGQALSEAGFESERVIDLLYEHVQRIALADLYRVELFERETRALLALEANAQGATHPYTPLDHAPLREYFFSHRESVRGNDLSVKALPFRLDLPELDGLVARSALIVPMFAGDELIGALSLFSVKAHGFFALQARNLFSMCAQASVAIQNARLYATERKRAGQLATVSEVSRQIASLLDLDELLRKTVALVRERFGYTNVHIFTVDRDAGYVMFRASTHPRGVEWRERGIGYRIGLEGLVGWVAATGKPLLVNDVSKEPRFAPYPDQLAEETKSEIVVPMTVGNDVTGVLDVESNQLNAFDDEDLFILKTLAAQLAVAVEDARLYNSQREEAYYLNVLLQVSQNLSAITDLDEGLETIVRITPLLVGVERCAILLYRAAEQKFVPAKEYGLTPLLRDRFFSLEFRTDGDFAFEKLFREHAPLMIENAATSPLLPRELIETFGIRSILMVPLSTRGEMVGLMMVDQGNRSTQFSQHEIDVVMGIANQAAVTIEGAQLTHAAEEKKRLDYELQLARQIQTSFLPDSCPALPGYEICSLWQTAREVSGDFYDFVQLNGGRLAITIADVSDKGMAAAMFMALSRTILRTMTIGKPSAREAIERANDVIIADARSDMFVTVFHAQLDPHAHSFKYVNAGHNAPLLYRAAKRELTTLKGHGIALGVFPDITLEEYENHLESGDILLMYTDGVTDAINANEEEFGAERLADLVVTNAQLNSDELIEEIKRAVTEFAGEGVHFDDLTMVVLKRVVK